MELTDLLVSYNLVKPDTSDTFIPRQTSISDRLALFSNYLNTYKKEDTSSSDTETSSEEPSTSAFLGWKYNTDSNNSSGISTTTWKSTYRGNKNKWVEDMKAAYKSAGLSDNAIKNLIAKNAHESGWGKSAQGKFNFGNITTGSSWKGDYVDGKDHNANGKVITNRFRSYNSLDDYVKDEIQFLTKLYDFDLNDDFKTFIGKLQGNNSGKRKYAEDKNYSNLVRGVYNSLRIGGILLLLK